MKIAMTHDQADFDAIASLFAASRLEDAIAVIPQKRNHNVNSFLVLYGSEFDFVEFNDLPQEAITHVTITDTQSVLTLRGMGAKTRISIVDHHPPRNSEPNPENHGQNLGERFVEFVELGATTTHFVERMQHHRFSLSAAQATLLLLGIYEDTGSLTYSKTTPRDIRAAAWLVEQGGLLSALPEYLNPPMNPQQVAIYDLLLDNMETAQIHGHRILISHAEIPTKVDEISTLAHKIRDLFEPDAVFILVTTPEGTRLIARSSTDDINVGEITKGFGGGGHLRAASALIRPEKDKSDSPLELLATLGAVLHAKIKPSIMVARLMSKKPAVLTPEQPVEQARQLMLKYGYEGFPVVQDGKVIGLLTRRSVDRATRHKLNFKVGNLMDAGGYCVHPADPIQIVQAVMTESGWGQIPVVDPASQKIVGIVTRTDLLRVLVNKRRAFASSKNIEKMLVKALEKDVLALINAIAECASEYHLPAYLVGGFVRDLLLGYPSNDIDCVIEGDAIQLGEKLSTKYGGRLTTHRRFGTARWYLQESLFQKKGTPEFVDLISARQEFYEQPSVLPSVEYGNIKHDLHRRDFTVNTLAIRIDGEHFGELHDYYGGKNDLEKKTIRVLHSLSFVDDPTRMIRAARYEARYGFRIDERTLQLMHEAGQLLAHLSPERIRHELDLIFLEAQPAVILSRLSEWGLLAAVDPAFQWDQAAKERIEAGFQQPIPGDWQKTLPAPDEHTRQQLGYCLLFAGWTKVQINKVQQKLGFSVKLLTSILETQKVCAQLAVAFPATPYDWVELLEPCSPISLYAIWLMTRKREIMQYVFEWKGLSAGINGKALIEKGLKPGPHFQHILQALKRSRLNGETSNPEEVTAQLGRMLDELKQKEQ